MPSDYSPHCLQWRISSIAEAPTTVAEPSKFNFLSFLATAQALRIEFLPLSWDKGRGIIGAGGTSTIQQALVNIDTSFAFKAYHRQHKTDKQNKTEEQVFRTIMNEITVLSQKFVREHANIAQLQGICWEISTDDRPWPILVFEKSHLGDLYDFATHGGRNMGTGERVRLCLDVGIAIMDMHTNSKLTVSTGGQP
jgi:hypothetical protein